MKMYNTVILSFILLVLCSCSGKPVKQFKTNIDCEIFSSDKEVAVWTTSGKVAGYAENGIYIYKGIPYANAERFMPPQQPSPWDGIRSCRAYGPTCPQGKREGWNSDELAFVFDWDDGHSGENCLCLNIWTQGINDKKKRPVMVWLHGGGYSAGSGQELPAYNGAQLCKKGDVVIVSLNHRLNILGFLDLSAFGEKYAQSGNVGLLDIITALKWVQNNINNFGGDPDNVTIFGQSGGGGKVTTLMASPMAKGLFHKAIVQSGSLLNTMSSKYSRQIGRGVMEELKLKPSQISELQTYPYEELLAAGHKVIQQIKKEAYKDGANVSLFGWAPTVDGNILPYQPDDPRALKQSKNIPLIVGSTLHEFVASAANPTLKSISRADAIAELKKKYGDRINEFLIAFDDAYPGYKTYDLFDVDFIFRPSVVKHATLKYNQQGAPVYVYLFAWESLVLNGKFRSMHCMELPFVFNNISRCNKMTGGGKQAIELADKMSSAWINFARSGDPNTNSLATWEPFTPQQQGTMVFDNTCKMKYNNDKELLEIMNSFPFKGF
jgi:para-nitrobenzyl esterase